MAGMGIIVDLGRAVLAVGRTVSVSGVTRAAPGEGLVTIALASGSVLTAFPSIFSMAVEVGPGMKLGAVVEVGPGMKLGAECGMLMNGNIPVAREPKLLLVGWLVEPCEAATCCMNMACIIIAC